MLLARVLSATLYHEALFAEFRVFRVCTQNMSGIPFQRLRKSTLMRLDWRVFLKTSEVWAQLTTFACTLFRVCTQKLSGEPCFAAVVPWPGASAGCGVGVSAVQLLTNYACTLFRFFGNLRGNRPNVVRDSISHYGCPPNMGVRHGKSQ